MKFVSNLFFTDIDFCKPKAIQGLDLRVFEAFAKELIYVYIEHCKVKVFYQTVAS